jgi:hypothetical protein
MPRSRSERWTLIAISPLMAINTLRNNGADTASPPQFQRSDAGAPGYHAPERANQRPVP